MAEYDDVLDPLMASFRSVVLAQMVDRVAVAYLQGSAQMIQWGRTKFTDRPIFFEGPPIEQAYKYANRHCARLVTQMDKQTKARLAQVISQGIDNKRGIPGLKRDIQREFRSWMSGAKDKLGRPIVNRAQMIARTETADALEQGFMDRGKDLGVTGKEWITFDPCEICEEFGNKGPVPFNYQYISSVNGESYDRPPAHPNCRCALAPVMLKER